MSAPFCAEGVAGEGVAELGHGAEVAGVELGDFDGLAALHDAEVRELFLAAAGVVLERGVVLDDAADDLEEGDAAGEGIGHGFEDHERRSGSVSATLRTMVRVVVGVHAPASES